MITVMSRRQSANCHPHCNPPKATELALAVGPLVPHLSACRPVLQQPHAYVQNFPHQPQVSNPSSSEDKGTGKIEKQTKIGSLVTLEHLEVSPSAQVVICRGTGQVIPSFVGCAAIQRLPRTLGLVRGHLVRGTSAGRGLQLCSRKIKTQR